jgi:hypothetical protein
LSRAAKWDSSDDSIGEVVVLLVEEEKEERRFPADERFREPRPAEDDEVRCERRDTDRVKSVTELVRLNRLLSRR